MNQNRIKNPNAYATNRSDVQEAFKGSLYDFQTYAQAGQSSLTFFAVPAGQSSKTVADTNMTLAGMLPSPDKFVVETIEIFVWPGNVIDTVAATATNAAGNADDVYNFIKSGYLEFNIGSKRVLQEAPLGKFPPSVGMRLEQMSSGTFITSDKLMRSSYAVPSGLLYRCQPELSLFPAENFSVTLNWPTAIAWSVAGRVGVVLGGQRSRNL